MGGRESPEALSRRKIKDRAFRVSIESFSKGNILGFCYWARKKRLQICDRQGCETGSLESLEETPRTRAGHLQHRSHDSSGRNSPNPLRIAYSSQVASLSRRIQQVRPKKKWAWA
jgi:hypothetical protein